MIDFFDGIMFMDVIIVFYCVLFGFGIIDLLLVNFGMDIEMFYLSWSSRTYLCLE